MEWDQIQILGLGSKHILLAPQWFLNETESLYKAHCPGTHNVNQVGLDLTELLNADIKAVFQHA